MPTWLIIILVVAAIGGLLGYLSGNDGERGTNAASGAVTGAMGCGYILFQIFLWGVGVMFMIWLFSAIFG